VDIRKRVVSEDGRFTVNSISKGTAPEAQLRVSTATIGERSAPVCDFSSKASYVANVGSTFYLLTDDRAERQRIVASTSKPARSSAGGGFRSRPFSSPHATARASRSATT